MTIEPGQPIRAADLLAQHDANGGHAGKLDANAIATGALDPARIPALDAGKITTGALDPARIPPTPTSYTLHANFNTLTNLPAAESEFLFRRVIADLTHKTEVRFAVYCSTAGAVGSYIRADYSLDEVSWGQFDPIGNTDVVTIDATGVRRTAWIPLPTAARADVIVRLMFGGGDGVADPAVSTMTLQAR